MAALALSLLGAANGIFWPGFNAMIGAVVPSGIRQRYFGVNFTLLNLDIGLGGMLAGSIVDVHRPGTFFAIYLGNALSFLGPLAVLLGPLRHVSGKVDHPVSEQDGVPIKTSYLDILRDRAPHRGDPCPVAVWLLSWLMTGLSGLLPGSPSAAILVICGMAVFRLGETLLQPTIPAITNDLSPDHLRGRHNAIMAGAFQLAAATGPVVAGVMLGARFNVEFIGILILGCALMAFIAIAVERRIPAQANDITTSTAELNRV